jgi:hypothetical protein
MGIERIYKTRECQRVASKKYLKNKVYRVCISFTPNDSEMVEWLKSQPDTIGVTIKKILHEKHKTVVESIDK